MGSGNCNREGCFDREEKVFLPHPKFFPVIASSHDLLLCCGSFADNGWLHKAVLLPSGVHLIEELQIFDQAQPVKSLVLSPQKVRKALKWNRVASSDNGRQ